MTSPSVKTMWMQALRAAEPQPAKLGAGLSPHERRELRQADRRPTATEKYVGLLLATHAWSDGTNVRPSAETIAAEAGVNRVTAQRARDRLAKLGWLELVEQGGSPAGGSRKASTYRLTLPVALDYRLPETARPVALDGPTSSPGLHQEKREEGYEDGGRPAASGNGSLGLSPETVERNLTAVDTVRRILDEREQPALDERESA